MLRILKSEFYKLRHTGFPWIHIILPVIYGMIFYFAAKFTGLRNFASSTIIQIFLVLLGGGLPIIIGGITSKITDMEAGAGHFQVFLSSTKSRGKAYLGKLIVLFMSGLFSISLAVSIFGFLYGNQNISSWMIEIILVFIGSLSVYMIHLWTSLRFGMGASLGLGFMESLFAFLSLTSLGDKIWYFLPCTWSSRLPATYIVGNQLPEIFYLYQDLVKWSHIAVPMTLVILICSLIWFRNWDGESIKA